MGVYVVSKGGITGTVADPRLILSVALKAAATGIILAHNHPSENLNPSRADEEITRSVSEPSSVMSPESCDRFICEGSNAPTVLKVIGPFSDSTLVPFSVVVNFKLKAPVGAYCEICGTNGEIGRAHV